MTSFRHHVPTRFLINRCQIITFLILKSDNIENSRIELKGIVWLGVKRVTEPNRTEPTDYTGRSLRKFPIVAVPGFTSQRMRYLPVILSLFLFSLLN